MKSIILASALLVVSCMDICHAEGFSIFTSSKKEVARVSTKNGLESRQDKFSQDRQNCISDPKWVPPALADRLKLLWSKDPDSETLELIRVLSPCLESKGWKIELYENYIKVPVGTLAAIDVELEKLNSGLPMPMDEYSNLVKIYRKDDKVIYSIELNKKADEITQKLIDFEKSDPKASEGLHKSIMRQKACQNPINPLISAGLTIVYEVRKSDILIYKSSISKDECK